MHFCIHCDNMYYIRIVPDENALVYYCRNCGYEDTSISTESVTVSKTELKKSEQQFSHIINQYTKLDPTLARTNKIPCPNADCATNTKDEPREIIINKYDTVNMKYIYLCSTCDTVWKTDEQK